MAQPPKHPVFCTACGEMLDDFCFSPEARDLEALRVQAFRCHLEGRHLGGVCAKLYIADDAHPAQPGDPPPAPGPAGDEAMRLAILSRIVREGGGEAPVSGGGNSA